jgi:hypothetical protein
MFKPTRIERTARERFMRDAEEEFAKFERKEREFR